MNLRQCTIAALIATIIFYSVVCFASPPAEPPNGLWKGLIAEAIGEKEKYKSLYAVCCVVRNRLEANMTVGLVGLKRKDLDVFVKRQGKAYERMAKEIVHKVFVLNGVDTTGGSVYFENIRKYGKPKWFRKEFVKIIGEQAYWR